MRRLGLLRLVFVNLGRDLRGNLLSTLGIAVGIAALVFFVALGHGVAGILRTKVFPVDTRSLEVVPPRVSLGLFGGGQLDDAAVERLAALQGVEAIHRRMQLRVPAISRYDGSFFGKRLRMGLEILAEGVDPGLIEAGLQEGESFEDPGEGGTVPMVLSPRLLEIYNKGFARARGLPTLSPSMLRGFRFPVDFGRSYVTAKAAAGPSAQQEVALVGFSDRAILQGITIPLESARRLNARFGEDTERYSAIVLVARSADGIPALAEAVRELGFEIDDSERLLAERIGAAVALVTAALALLSLLICGLATVNTALALGAAIRSREREIGILRAVGASSRSIFSLILGEALAIGVAGGAVGVGLALGAAHTVDRLALTLLPEFPFRPDSFFSFPLWLLVGAAAAGALAAVLGAALPARRAARIDPARAMGG